MLKEVYHMQRMFNNKVIGFDILAIEKEEERIKWFRNYLTAYDQELKELLESLDIRRVAGCGKAQAGSLDLRNIKVEVVDMLHFLLSMFQVIGEKEVSSERLGGRPADLNAYFDALRSDFMKANGEELAGRSEEQINRMMVLVAHENLVSLGKLLDCIAWKWWARQQVKWDEVKSLLYDKIFPQWCMMAIASGMSADDTEELYFKKNRLNFERQQKGYKEGTYNKVDEEGREDNVKLFK
ncbi:MAG: dUTP diphosphatase [Pseudomonadota bacterium]